MISQKLRTGKLGTFITFKIEKMKSFYKELKITLISKWKRLVFLVIKTSSQLVKKNVLNKLKDFNMELLPNFDKINDDLNFDCGDDYKKF